MAHMSSVLVKAGSGSAHTGISVSDGRIKGGLQRSTLVVESITMIQELLETSYF